MIGLQRKLIVHTLINITGSLAAWFLMAFLILPNDWPIYIKILFFSLSIVVILALAVIHLVKITQGVSRSILKVAQSITALSRGNEEVRISQSNTLEIQEIVKAAEILQFEMNNREKERRQWTQDITHDLRTPITAIKSQLQAIRDGVFTLDEDRYNLLFGELAIIEKMVQDFSLLGRIESPEMKQHQKWVLSQRLMDTLVQRFNMQTLEKNIELKQETGYFYFKTDDNLFLRAASNLVSNALQYTNENGIIYLRLLIQRNQIMFSVENSGMIPEEDLPFIFQRLYRGEKSRTTSGSGLGLTIAKSIAQLQNGDIQARNTERGTTVFEMTINMVF